MTVTVTTIADWERHIATVHPAGVELGLERVREVAGRLEALPPAPLVLVIAGTNGKGSTAVFAEGLLEAAGYRTFTTLSPHLERYNERFRIDGEAASDEAICAALATVEAARGDVTLTYFEFSILAALVLCRNARPEVAVLEVGLGGRLDAVNLVDADVAVITSIGLDHQHYLGDDRDSIGREKAGILRRGRPLVYGGTDAMPASVAAAARALDVPVAARGGAFDYAVSDDGWCYRDGPTRITALPVPAVALDNAATAVAAVRRLGIEVGPHGVAAAAGRALPGRFETHVLEGGRSVVLDVAHNPHAAAFTAARLAAHLGRTRCHMVLGMLADKDARGVAAALAPLVAHWHCVPTDGDRALCGEALAGRLATVGARPCDWYARFDHGMMAALEAAPRVAVLGSFNVIQNARRFLRRS